MSTIPSELNDTLTGTEGNDTIRALGGADLILGLGGDDDLDGGSGRDTIDGGDGNDRIDSSTGDPASEGYGDVIRAGLGANVIIGNANSYYSYSGGGLDLIYDGLPLVGGITITVGEDGTGTAVSGISGLIDDIFTYADYFVGTDEADQFYGSAAEEGFEGRAGNDTIDGGGTADDGIDFAVYRDGGIQGIVVNLVTGVATDTFGDIDTLINIEAIDGSQWGDSIIGDENGNFVFGNDGDDSIEGGSGRDTIFGGAGNDVIDSSTGDADSEWRGDIINPGLGSNVIIGNAEAYEIFLGGLDLYYDGLEPVGGITVTVFEDGTGTVVSGTAGMIDDIFSYADKFIGTSENDSFYGGSAQEESFRGGDGEDYINGGMYLDTGIDFAAYDDGNGWRGIEVDLEAGWAIDTFGKIDTLVHIEGIDGSQWNDFISGSTADNQFFAYEGNDTIVTGDGRDFVDGGGGDDLIDSSTGDALSEGYGDMIRAGLGTNVIVGNQAAYNSYSGGGVDLLYDRLEPVGGVTVIVNADGTGTTVSGTEGLINDTFSYADYFVGTDDADSFFGSAAEEGFEGRAGNDTIDGGGTAADGIDFAVYRDGGIQGIDVDLATGFAVDTFGDTDLLINIEAIEGSQWNDTITGDDKDNLLFGADGNDTIKGGSGRDFIDAGDGDDLIDGSTGDVDTEGFGDIVRAGLGANFIYGNESTYYGYSGGGLDLLYDGLPYVGGITITVDDEGSGTAVSGIDGMISDTFTFADYFVGTDDADQFYGGANEEGFEGRAGNDTIDGGGDLDSGTDFASYVDGGWRGIDVNLAAQSAVDTFGNTDTLINIEGIDGSRWADRIRGDTRNNIFFGYDGNDTLEGGSGNDSVYGGEGSDLVFGGFGDDSLEGGSGDDTLDAGTGNDTLSGGIGNDTYVTDGNDILTENPGEGVDTVRTFGSFELGAQFENLTLIGTAAINGTGNALNNTLTGNSASNILNGGAGIDTLIGGAGNDTYVTDGGDTITEALNGGTDLVQSSATHSLAANVENLTLTGTSAINGTGNSVANTLTGNSAANTLNGGSGNDTLIGGANKDLLTGGSGIDHFVFRLASDSSASVTSADVITDFVRGTDKISLSDIDAFAVGGTSNDTFVWRGTSTFSSSTSGEVRYQRYDNSGTTNDYTMVFIDTDADTSVEMSIRVNGLHSFTSSDFIL